MRRLTKIEKKAAMAVLAMTGAVVVSGVKLLRKHTRYMAQKATAFFADDKEQRPPAQEMAGQDEKMSEGMQEEVFAEAPEGMTEEASEEKAEEAAAEKTEEISEEKAEGKPAEEKAE